ncbi:MAG: hypothetical protein PGN37_24050 [Mycobacterium kyogaense]|uniref:hypothetical protein n=1 Tax=Mycobacterium kyogaense TaxID=2212479 RepID=UPI002FF46105
MYSELCALPNVSVYLDGALDEKSVHHAGRAAGTPTVRVDIRCSAAPVAIEVDDGRTVVCTRSADGESRYPG